MASKEKKERMRLLKEQRKTEARKERTKSKMKKYAFRIMLVLGTIIVAYFIYASNFDYSGKGILQPVKEYHDFGAVSVKGDVVLTNIEIMNIGEGDLTINSIDTSCGCTSAKIINDGTESPVFGMRGHTLNPTDWSTVIPAGEKAVVRIYYDPKAHPNLRGAVTRMVNIYSDDPSDRVREIRIGVTQID